MTAVYILYLAFKKCCVVKNLPMKIIQERQQHMLMLPSTNRHVCALASKGEDNWLDYQVG